jgi:hypothetical protein
MVLNQLYVDVSNIGVATFSKLAHKGQDRPICYVSRQFIPTKQNYIVTEQETLAIIFVMKFFWHYLSGNKFTIIMNHQVLKYLLSKNGELTWWGLFSLLNGIIDFW